MRWGDKAQRVAEERRRRVGCRMQTSVSVSGSGGGAPIRRVRIHYIFGVVASERKSGNERKINIQVYLFRHERHDHEHS